MSLPTLLEFFHKSFIDIIFILFDIYNLQGKTWTWKLENGMYLSVKSEICSSFSLSCLFPLSSSDMTDHVSQRRCGVEDECIVKNVFSKRTCLD